MSLESEASTVESSASGDAALGTTSHESASTTSTASESAAAGSTGDTHSGGQGSQTSESSEVDENGAPISAKAFAPNVKIKVKDKEFEIPKSFQGLMKDADTEKEVRELFEKAHGLDFVKERQTEVRQERDQLAQENTQIKASIDGLRATYQKAVSSGNLHKLDDFFAGMKIPQQVVMQYALAKVKLAEMAPEQRQAVESQLNSERQLEQAETQRQATERQYAEQAVQAKTLALDLALQNPTVSSAAKKFEQMTGGKMSFRDAVIQRGELEWNQSRGQVNLTPEQAAQKVIENFGLNLTPPVQAQAATQVPNGATGQQATHNGKPVVQRTTATIPNIQSKSGSPLKGKPKSIEDLKTLYKQSLK